MGYTKRMLESDFNKTTELMGDYIESQRKIKDLESELKNVETKLKSLLDWSDRIGSDEIYEINEIIKLIKQNQDE